MKKYLLVILTIGLVLALSGCEDFFNALGEIIIEPYAFVENEAGEPMAEVSVELIKDGTVIITPISNENGRVGFGERAEGTYTIKATKEGYVTFEKVVAIGKLAQFLGYITMVEIAFEPYAYVEDEEGNGIAGADVTLTDADDGTQVFTGATGTSGYIGFGIAETWEGDYTLTVEMEGYDTVSITVTIAKTAQFLGKIILRSTLSITGKVIDAKTDRDTDDDGTNDVDYTPIDGVTLTLIDADGTQVGDPVVSATDGTFSFNDVDSGTYTITAAKTDCAFIDETVEVLDEDLDVGVILGFPAPDPTTISIIVTWSNSYEDVDAYLTYPSSYKPTGDLPVLTDPYVNSGLDDTGFEPASVPVTEPDPANPTREKIYYNNTTSTNTLGSLQIEEGSDVPVVELDVDDRDGSGPETISVRYIPFDWLAVWEGTSYDEMWFSTYGSTDKSLTPGVDYAWVGVMEYYVNGTDADSSDGTVSDNLMEEGASGGADVTVYITQGTEVKGRYIIPDYTNVRTAAVIRINLMVEAQYDESSNINGAQELFQILPDIRVFQSDAGIKGISDDSGILVLKGNKISL